MKTGPTSAEGKAISSQNSYQHGVYSAHLRLRDDEKADYAVFESGLRAELNPEGTLQNELFIRLLRTFWLLRRLDRREDDVYCDTGLPLAAAFPKEFENTLRYRRFLTKEQRELTAELSRLQQTAAAMAATVAASRAQQDQTVPATQEEKPAPEGPGFSVSTSLTAASPSARAA